MKPKNSTPPPPLPAPHIVAEVTARKIVDYDGLIRWWTDLPAAWAWLRTMPADLALRMALQGVPHPDGWAHVRSGMGDTEGQG